MVLPPFVSAAILEPYDYKTDVVAGDNGEYIVTVDLPKDDIYWVWGNTPADFVVEHTETGASSTFNTTEDYLDNWFLYIYTFGFDHALDQSNMFSTKNLTTDATLNIWFQLVMSCNTSQDFDLKTTVRIAYCDSSGTVLSRDVVYTEDTVYEAGYNLQTFLIADNSYTIDSSLGDYFFLYITVDPANLPDESVTSSVACGIYDNMNQIVMPLKSLYVQSQESNQTNKILASVENQLAENGQKLDDLLTGGDAGDDLISGGDKLEDAGEGLGDDIGQIGDFEDQYFGQLEDNLDEVIAGADLSLLVSPLLFIQVYLNKIVAGTPSKYLVVFTLPVLFGIFMYIVGHPIRAPRPDTSGDVVTRETFTTTTVLDGPRAGSTTSSRTVTTSQEIGRIHSG